MTITQAGSNPSFAPGVSGQRLCDGLCWRGRFFPLRKNAVYAIISRWACVRIINIALSRNVVFVRARVQSRVYHNLSALVHKYTAIYMYTYRGLYFVYFCAAISFDIDDHLN